MKTYLQRINEDIDHFYNSLELECPEDYLLTLLKLMESVIMDAKNRIKGLNQVFNLEGEEIEAIKAFYFFLYELEKKL